jgi:hypothetical protein
MERSQLRLESSNKPPFTALTRTPPATAFEFKSTQ